MYGSTCSRLSSWRQFFCFIRLTLFAPLCYQPRPLVVLPGLVLLAGRTRWSGGPDPTPLLLGDRGCTDRRPYKYRRYNISFAESHRISARSVACLSVLGNGTVGAYKKGPPLGSSRVERQKRGRKGKECDVPPLIWTSDLGSTALPLRIRSSSAVLESP